MLCPERRGGMSQLSSSCQSDWMVGSSRATVSASPSPRRAVAGGRVGGATAFSSVCGAKGSVWSGFALMDCEWS